MVYDHDNYQDGISLPDALKRMIWAGTGVLWTVSSSEPKSLKLLGATEAAAGTPTC
jgi:hypothetical protein